jgi:hypothetical protein
MAEEMNETGSFNVMDCAAITIAVGRKVWTIRELRDALVTIEPSSIYHHFWGGFLAPRFREREFNNDFASWVWHEVGASPLAERLAIVDPTTLDDLEALRAELVDIIDDHLDLHEQLAWLPARMPFHFVRSQLVVFDTGVRAESRQELARIIPDLSDGSVFYHVIDARRRPPNHVDDLRAWLSCLPGDHGQACRRLAEVDPYFTNLTELRDRLAAILQGHTERKE